MQIRKVREAELKTAPRSAGPPPGPQTGHLWTAALQATLREVDALEELQMYLPTFRSVPRPANAGWADAVQGACLAVSRERHSEDAWQSLELLSRLLLWAPTRERAPDLPPANKAEAVLRRLSLLFAGQTHQPLAEAREAAR